jgi:hypothetical protein
MDIPMLKQLQDKINKESVEELLENIPPTFLQFSNSPTIKSNLLEVKTRRKINQSARVLHNWIQQGIIQVEESDRGKINRFSRLESIWLNIVTEARKFGLPLESLQQSRKEIFEAPIPNFSILKFFVLDSILRKPRILLIYAEGNTNVLSLESYSKWVATGHMGPHLSFNLLHFIQPEFPNESFETDFGILEPYNDPNKCKLLYYLKTGDFKNIKLYINSQDVRLIENSAMLLKNSEILNVIKQWEFQEAVITTSSDAEDIIHCQL